MKKTIRLTGLDCANCAASLEREILALQGVERATIVFATQKLTVEYTEERVLEKVVATVNAFEQVRVLDGSVSQEVGERLVWIWVILSALALAVAVIFERFGGVKLAFVSYTAYALAYISAGFSVWKGTWKGLRKGRIFDENFLMCLASVGAVCIGEYFEAVAVVLLYRVGENLQSLAVGKSRRSVAKIVEMKGGKTTVIRKIDGKPTGMELDPEQICVGDTVLVKTGEKVPVDGELLSKRACLDTKPLTGEAELIEYETGAPLSSGCINAGAVFQMRAVRVFEESAVGRILDIVENAASRKSESEKFVTRFAKIYTPVVCACAVALAFVAPLVNGLIIGQGLRFVRFTRWLKSALTFLVVSCPCALVISVPLTYFSGIGACAKRGILVKGSAYLDALAKTRIVAFDKTGTLTEGSFRVLAVYPENGVTEAELLTLVASAERFSSHPISAAFSTVKTEVDITEVSETVGRGLEACLDGKRVLVGSGAWLKENGVRFAERESAYTLVYAAVGERFLGVIEIGDQIKTGAKRAVSALQTLGVKETVMLTGDNALRAERVASEVGVSAFKAGLLPDGKLREAEKLKGDGVLVFVGDGINDAPVMTVADCGVAMGKLGSAVAVETADVVLISDDLQGLPTAIRLAKKTRRIVRQNLVFSIAMKAVFATLGLFGALPLFWAVFADVGVMLVAVCNSLRVNTGSLR